MFHVSCKRESKIKKQEDQIVLNAPPIGQPTFPGDINNYVDQWKRLSIGFTCLFNDPATCNNFDFRILINNKVATNQNNPIRNGYLYSNILSIGFDLNVPSPSNHDLYDALANRIGIFNPPTSISAWDNSFFYAFNNQLPGGTDGYFVTITLPLREFQLSNNNLTKPALVCPDPEIFNFPMVAYGYSGSAISEIQIPDEDFYFDLIESGDYAVFALQYNYEAEDNSTLEGNCEGGWAPLDDACDGNCGENESNSPNDCGDHTKNKVLYIREFTINEDHANKQTGFNMEQQHWERASGNYEPGFSCWNMQNNGHFQGIKYKLFDQVPLSKVTRKRTTTSNPLTGKFKVYTRGNSISIPAHIRNTSDPVGEAIVANNYNPVLGTIYISFFEHDGMRRIGKKQVPVLHNSVEFDKLEYRGPKGCFTAGKSNSNCWPASPPIPATLYYNRIIHNLIWVQETYNGEEIMAYYHYDIFDKVNYVLYYLKNRRAW